MDASHSSSGKSVNDYSASLIGTVSELRMELQRTMSEIQSLKDQNRSLQGNNKSLKDELVETRRKYAEAQENYMATVTEKLDAERKNEAFLDRLKKQLSDKSKEFESLRDKFTPKDVDQLRIEVQRELEGSHNEKIEKIRAEMQEEKNRFFALKRQLDVMRAEAETTIHSLKRELGASRRQHEDIEKKLREEVQRLLEREIPQEKEEKQMRQLIARIQELEYLTNLSKVENAQLRKERDDLEVALDQSNSKREQVSADLRAKVAIVESQQLALEHQTHLAKEEVERKESQMRTMARQVDEMAGLLEATKKEAAEAETRLVTLAADHANIITDLKSQFELEKAELELQIDSFQEKVREREEHVRRAQRTATEMQVRVEAVETELRRENQFKINEMTKKFAAVEVQLAEERMAGKTTELQNKRSMEELSGEVDILKSELARITREKEVLHDKVRDLEGKLETERRQGVSARREAEATIKSLETTAKDMKFKMTELENKCLSGKTREVDLQYSIQALQAKLDTVQAEHSAVIEALKGEARKQTVAQDRMYTEKLEKIKENSRALVEKEKKRAQAYKEKAQDALRRGKALSDAALAAAAGSFGFSPSGASVEDDIAALAAALPLR